MSGILAESRVAKRNVVRLLQLVKKLEPKLSSASLLGTHRALQLRLLTHCRGEATTPMGHALAWAARFNSTTPVKQWPSLVIEEVTKDAAVAFVVEAAAKESALQPAAARSIQSATDRYFALLPEPLTHPDHANELWRAQLTDLVTEPLATLHQLTRRLDKHISAAAALYHREQRALATREAAGLADFCALFPAARAMRRKFIFFAGPTNSGKSYAGFELLVKANTGIYLAPLRLLALEGQERIESSGVPCNLLTGEERVLRPDSRHTAATIEMLDPDVPVDVAMIDEVQLLADPDRGWAWTQACLGVAAPLVVLTGSAEAEPLIRRLIALTGDELEVQHCERLTKLSSLSHRVGMSTLQPGDAVIAFSRRDVLELRDDLLERGHRVAVIYGALGPEVRRAEAERFRSGEAQIMVATDAIGMGLNLPIRRVLFSTLIKFDGEAERPLACAEVKQIGGRAGRYGQYEEGFVGGLQEVHPQSVINALAQPNPAPVLRQFWVQPPWRAVEHVANELDTTQLGPVLRHIGEVVLSNDPRWRSPMGEDFFAMAHLLDCSPLSLRQRYQYLGTPIDTRTDYASEIFLGWLHGHADEDENPAPSLRVDGVPTAERALDTLEQDAKLLTAYLWLALRWPRFYPYEPEARATQQQANQMIAAALRAKRLPRTCRKCGHKLARGHRFALCEPCFARQRPMYW